VELKSNDVNYFFVEFYSLKVGVSTDKKSKLWVWVQDAIANNLGTAYNEVVKVNSDDEMIDLMKFQAAFSANAQVISAVDEMIKLSS
jgi:flagellar hook-associated protein 1 FlgK